VAAGHSRGNVNIRRELLQDMWQKARVMRIMILGAGVQGTLYGVRLARAGHDVTLIARANGWKSCGSEEPSLKTL
jgi:hypothetical protein